MGIMRDNAQQKKKTDVLENNSGENSQNVYRDSTVENTTKSKRHKVQNK